MILSPLQNRAFKLSNWIQLRPHITQKFGNKNSRYLKYSMSYHNGVDLRAPMNTLVFAPIDGKVELKNYGNVSYGKHIVITNNRLKVVLGHLNDFLVTNGQQVKMGERIAFSGSTGDSTGPHLHLGLYNMINGKTANQNSDTGGAYNPIPWMITWKGTLKTNNI